MLAIEIDLLTGKYVATSFNDRFQAEWPPHPARFFSALVAALHDRCPVDNEERQALLWLEAQGPPALDVDLGAGRRSVRDVFVPVNDITLVGDPEERLREARRLGKPESVIRHEERRLREFLRRQLDTQGIKISKRSLKTASALLPSFRIRQVRTFPVVIPERPWFAFIWSADIPDPLRAGLARLCERVTRLGHSSSLVRCVISNREIMPNLVPAEEGPFVLRVFGKGQLERLEHAHERHKELDSRVLPYIPQRYRSSELPAKSPEPPCTIFSEDWIIFQRVGGARLMASRGPELAKVLRRAILEQAGNTPLPPTLSGHQEDGRPLEGPHLAFVALPFVGHPHADGSIQGIALIPPRDLSRADQMRLNRLVASLEIERSKKGVLELRGDSLPPILVRRIGLPDKTTLKPDTWCRPSRYFLTATPIALDRNPGNLRSHQIGTVRKAAQEAQRIIALSCERIGLPSPISVDLSLTPVMRGSLPISAFTPWPGTAKRNLRVKVYAEIRFESPVRGPLLIGAGRYFGLGLCLPVYESTHYED